MNRLALLAAFALFLPLTAHADDASLQAKAKEMVTLLHTDRMVTQVSTNIRKQIADAAEKTVGADPAPEAKTKLADFQKKVSDIVDAQVGWTVMESAFTDIYAKTFTEDELTGIIAFYKSPAGIAFLDKTPTVNSQVTRTTQPKLGALQQQLRQTLDDFRKSQTPAAAPTAAPTLGPPPTASTPK